MKKLLSVILTAFMLIPLISVPKTKAINFPFTRTTLKSRSAMLMNLDTNTVVHEKNADEIVAPGPLVNIMTAVIVLEKCDNLKQEITLDPEVYGAVRTSPDWSTDIPWGIDIEDGDVLSVRDLLYCMMLTSSVEASQSLAYFVGGNDSTKFVQMMNDKAKDLGMTNTVFTNAHGMHDVRQHTTARDMMTLTRYALTVPLFSEISTAVSYNPEVPNVTRHPNHSTWVWKHSNVMADPKNDDCYFMGAKGIKTARLNEVGRNLVVQASRDGNNYLAVLMIAPIKNADGDEKYFHIEDATSLFSWAFSSFSYKIILSDTTEVGSRDVTLGDSQDYVLACPKDEILMLWCNDVPTTSISQRIKWNKESFQAPVHKGDVLGEITLEYSGEVLSTVDLVANTDIGRSKGKYNLEVAKKFIGSNWFKAAVKISLVLTVLYVLLCVYAWILFKNKGKPVKPLYAVPKMNKPKKKKAPSGNAKKDQ